MNDQTKPYAAPATGTWFVADARSNPVREKSFDFALAIVELCRNLQSEREYIISKQLMKSGTAIGANIEESISAESRKDFLHKMNLALKEARESHYWLRLLEASEIAIVDDIERHLAASEELVKLLAAITKTVSGR